MATQRWRNPGISKKKERNLVAVENQWRDNPVMLSYLYQNFERHGTTSRRALASGI
jgi:hypothetical protein